MITLFIFTSALFSCRWLVIILSIPTLSSSLLSTNDPPSNILPPVDAASPSFITLDSPLLFANYLHSFLALDSTQEASCIQFDNNTTFPRGQVLCASAAASFEESKCILSES